jgi:DNA-binding winged helix-turn-helix (wHTH) protein/Tfp pilus assembly protein PilF
MDTGCGHLVYRFGDFELDTSQDTVAAWRSGERVKLTARVRDTLRYLVEHAGELVTKTALMEAVWSGVIVEEGNVTQTVHVLRRALGESPHAHRYIVTVPGRGYRFVATVTRRYVTSPPPRTGRTARPSIASLAAAASLAVVAGLIMGFEFGDDGREPAANAAPATSEPPATDRSTRESGAQEALLLGQFYFYRRAAGDLMRARNILERAQVLAPDDAEIPALLAGVYMILGDEGQITAQTAREQQRAAAERALRLDPELPEAHLRLAQYFSASSESAAARAHYERGLALGRTRPLALSMAAGDAARRGQIEEAIELQRRSVEIEPLAVVQRVNLGIYLLAAGRLREAEAEFRQAWALNPMVGNPELVHALILQRRPGAALPIILRWPRGELQDQALAMAYHGLGRLREAETAVDRLLARDTRSARLRLAEVMALRGERDAAFELLERARATPRDPAPQAGPKPDTEDISLQLSPFLLGLRQDPRWHAMLRKG